MQNEIKKVCVIGAGVMGSGIAALIANSSYKIVLLVLLDIIAKDSNDPNKIVNTAKENLHKQKPPPLSFPDRANFITIGNLEYDLDLIKECDLVIEVIVEKLEIKHQLYNKIIPYLKEDAIIASNTSTLPLERLKENLPDNIKSRFVITHFFNPLR
ncbi:3-hydroxyacyl-CoA dehydrogenase family protein [Rickettsia africae]|uniref:3-hydroxyacyl-CoA dehydrogenase family protein n=1 Tax=Rickettsia africae TaxID=35788 RepID=UPI000169C812|nr:3-hydroxyacyl-CoA dehydrogenase family protein [Rickettsia africae]